VLREVDGLAVTVTSNFDSKEPVELAEISYLNMLGDFAFKRNDEGKGGGSNGAIIDMNNNDYASMTIVTVVMIEHSLVDIASHKHQMLHKNFHELLIPMTT